MLRIVLIQRFLPSRSRGGVGVFTHGLSNALVDRGHTVTVFSQDPAPADAHYRVVQMPPASSGIGRKLAPLSFAFQVARLDLRAFDVVHAQGDEHLLPRSNCPPVVRTMHGTALAEAIFNGWRMRSPKRFVLHFYFYLCELLAAIRADAVVAVSHHTTRFYPRACRTIPNGIDPRIFHGTLAGKSHVPTILFVGEANSRKRGWLLAKVFQEEVRPRIPEAKLWLVGPDSIEAPGIECFTSATTSEVADLFRQAWVLCLPSSYEGFGLPYVEGMASAAAVVASPNPGAREVLDGGRCGMIATDDRLGEVLCRLLGEPELRGEYVRRGLERAKEFTWDRVAGLYEALYESVVSARCDKRSACDVS